MESVQTFGRKKTAVAVAYCKKGRGLMKINGVPIELVKPEILKLKVYEPILLLGSERFAGVDIRIRVKGGGYTSQIYGAQTCCRSCGCGGWGAVRVRTEVVPAGCMDGIVGHVVARSRGSVTELRLPPLFLSQPSASQSPRPLLPTTRNVRRLPAPPRLCTAASPCPALAPRLFL